VRQRSRARTRVLGGGNSGCKPWTVFGKIGAGGGSKAVRVEAYVTAGAAVLEVVRVQFPDLYFASIVKLSQIIRSEADVKTTITKPKTIDEVLAQVEAEGGPEGRKAFEGFLRKMIKIKEEQGNSFSRKLGDEQG
jgi:hypothetical protein